MVEKYMNKYNSRSNRMKSWNYGWQGDYFITFCTENGINFLGSIKNGIFLPSEIGKIVDLEWLKSPVMRPDMNLQLGPYVVMPNHFHGIITIGENKYNSRDALQCVSTANNALGGTYTSKNIFGPQRKNLGSIIGGFKTAVVNKAKKYNVDFGWHDNYNDSIIRSRESYNRIASYINSNIKNLGE